MISKNVSFVCFHVFPSFFPSLKNLGSPFETFLCWAFAAPREADVSIGRSPWCLGDKQFETKKSNELINSFCVSSIENLLNRLESLCCIFVSWMFHVWFHHIDFVLGEVTDVSQLHLASLVASLLHVFSFVFLFIFCVRCSQPRTTVDRRLGRRMRRSKIWHRKP